MEIFLDLEKWLNADNISCPTVLTWDLRVKSEYNQSYEWPKVSKKNLPGFTRVKTALPENTRLMFDLCCVILFMLFLFCFDR